MRSEFKFPTIRLESYKGHRNKLEIFTSKNLALISGTSNIPLARKVANIIKQDLGSAAGRHPEGEVGVQLPASVDGMDVFIVQPTNPNANNLMELLLIIQACKLSGADRIHAIVPYYGYARQDRKDAPRVPISARLVTDMIEVAGASTINTLNIHAEQILGFFRGQWNDLSAANLQIEKLNELNLVKPCLATVDLGGSKLIRKIARKVGLNPDKDTAITMKEKSGENQNALFLNGDVRGRDVVIFDDIINSAKSLTDAAKLIDSKGAGDIYAFVTHGMMFNEDGEVSTRALKSINNSPIKTLFLTDTVQQPLLVVSHPKIQIISVAPIIAEAIKRIHRGQSLSPDLVLE